MFGTGITDLGSVRKNNEDSILVINGKVGPLENLYIVSDGMGGHNAGEIASGKAIEYFVDYIRGCNDIYSADQASKQSMRDSWLADMLRAAVGYANQNVYGISCNDPVLEGMGATFTAMTIKDERVHIVHMGDSRAYLASEGRLTQLTTDHTYVNDLLRAEIISDEQARTHHLRNVITRALGSEQDCEVDYISLELEKGDVFLMCSDGLSNMLEDTELYEYLAQGRSLEEAAVRLVDAANKSGGDDNISVIVVAGGDVL